MAATESAAAAPSPADVVSRERRIRPRVGLAALAAALLSVLSGVIPQFINRDAPHVYVLDSLRDAAGQSIGRPGLRTDVVLYLHDKATLVLLSGVVDALLALALTYVLLELLRAALDRGASTSRAARLMLLVGGIAAAVGALGAQIGLVVAAADFAHQADHSTKAAHDALNAGAALAFGGVRIFATLAFAGGFVLATLAAMRVGLLTRFVGILGAIVGVLLVLGPALGGSFIVQAFWLVMVGALWLGRWPSGLPPAWSSGEAHPWPSQQEIREQRAAARGDRRGARTKEAPAAPTDAGPDEAVGAAPSPATSKKKKRKRRA